MTNPTAAIDFLADWRATLQQRLTGMGYPANPSDSFQIVSTKYFNARHRRITQQPRDILKAPQFSCPPELAMALSRLGNAIQVGTDLMPYQSTRLSSPKFDDYLLNDWDIHHLHLGTGPHPKVPNFVARSGPVLFARLTSNTAYFIGVLAHGSWTMIQLIEILHQNWPSSIQEQRIAGAVATEKKPADIDVEMLRGANVNTLLEIAPGVVYRPLGGGYTLDGTAMRVAMTVTRSVQTLRKLEKWTRANTPALLKQIAQRGLTPATPPRFSLIVDQHEVHIRENGSGFDHQINEPMLTGWLA